VTVAISCCVITLNEADRLEACLRAASAVADELLVVDSGSTDGTQEVARRLGARVLHRDWTGYGQQKRFAELEARNDWILSLDADEVLSPELQAEIRALMAQEPPLAAYRMNIVAVHPGRERPHWGAEGYNIVRLYDRRRATYSEHPVHDRIETGDEPLGQLDGIVLHFSWRSLEHLRAKMQAYADYQAEVLSKPALALALRLPFEYPLTLAKYLFLRRNIFSGWTGIRISHMTALVRTSRIYKMLNKALGGRRRVR